MFSPSSGAGAEAKKLLSSSSSGAEAKKLFSCFVSCERSRSGAKKRSQEAEAKKLFSCFSLWGSRSRFFFFPTWGKTHSRKKNSKTHLENSGVGNVYEYKDGEEGGDAATAAGADGEALRALIGNNWIDPPKRERKRVQSYNEAEAFRQTLKPGGGGGPRASAAPRLPKMPQLQDFQFYDVPRITALYEKEANFEAHKHSLAEKARSARAQGASEEVVQAQIAPGPDDPQPLSEEEVAEREALLSSGFANWNRRDFGAFIRACEKVRRRGREFFFFL